MSTPPKSRKASRAKNPTTSAQLLSRVGQVFAANKSLETALMAVANLVRAALDFDRCSIMLLDRQRGVLKLIAAAGIPEKFWSEITMSVGEGVAGKVVLERKPVFVEDISSSEYAHAAHHERYSTRSFFCVPITVHGDVVGVLNANSREDRPPCGREELELLIAIAAMMGLCIANAELFSEKNHATSLLSATFEALPGAAILVDRNLQVDAANREAKRWLGLAADAKLRHTALLEMWPQLDGTETLGKLREALSRNTRVGTVETLAFPSGVSAEVEVNISSLAHQPDDRQALVLLRDLRTSAHVDSYKSEFLSLLAHELRTPFAALQAASELLLGTPPPAESGDWAKMLQIVSTNTRRLLTVVNSLLDLHDIEHNSLELHKDVVRIDEIINEITPLFEADASKKRLRIITTVVPVTCSADRRRLSQMIAALLDNAIKFSPPDTAVEVSCEKTDDKFCLIKIRDHGYGVPPEILFRHTARFNQVEALTTRSSGGLGVGLFLVRTLTNLHGGTFELESAQGEGTCALIRLPLASVASETGA
ncbi:MAG: ATP-binding protein [Candidatus Sumerlaeaceae bacterium]|nr:ATP-binding protein [Candidatus Sumerlaeaceae bacterium]